MLLLEKMGGGGREGERPRRAEAEAEAGKEGGRERSGLKKGGSGRKRGTGGWQVVVAVKATGRERAFWLRACLTGGSLVQ
jgi:hypothetical protein